MNNQTTLSSTRVRNRSHVIKSRFLHVEDALNIGKIRLFAGNYRKGQGMDAHSHHFVGLADARVVLGHYYGVNKASVIKSIKAHRRRKAAEMVRLVGCCPLP